MTVCRVLPLSNPIGNGSDILSPNPIGNGRLSLFPYIGFLTKPGRAGSRTSALKGGDCPCICRTLEKGMPKKSDKNEMTTERRKNEQQR